MGSTANVLRGTGGALILAGFDHLKTVYLKWKFMIDPGKSLMLAMILIIFWPNPYRKLTLLKVNAY